MVITVLIASFLVGMSVFIHYEALLRVSEFMLARSTHPRMALVLGILSGLVAHVVEIFIFAGGYYGLIQAGSYGTLKGDLVREFGDCLYFSFVTYTTLGFGDLVPTGPIRFLTGIEALTGLVLIAWTASFLYIQMQKILGKTAD